MQRNLFGYNNLRQCLLVGSDRRKLFSAMDLRQACDTLAVNHFCTDRHKNGGPSDD